MVQLPVRSVLYAKTVTSCLIVNTAVTIIIHFVADICISYPRLLVSGGHNGGFLWPCRPQKKFWNDYYSWGGVYFWNQLLCNVHGMNFGMWNAGSMTLHLAGHHYPRVTDLANCMLGKSIVLVVSYVDATAACHISISVSLAKHGRLRVQRASDHLFLHSFLINKSEDIFGLRDI